MHPVTAVGRVSAVGLRVSKAVISMGTGMVMMVFGPVIILGPMMVLGSKLLGASIWGRSSVVRSMSLVLAVRLMIARAATVVVPASFAIGRGRTGK